jgi:hypothetical protein
VIAGQYFDSGGVHHGFVRAATGTITTFNAPGAGTAKNQGTVAEGINTAGTIAGQYFDSGGVHHGFVRATTGTITTFNAPGAGTGIGQGTVAYGINDSGVIAGSYFDSGTVGHGFVRATTGTITTFNAPGAGTAFDQGTDGSGGINTAGGIAGHSIDSGTVFHGLVLIPATATTTTQSSSPNPSTYGEAVKFTAAVTSSLGAPPNGETVSFMKGKTVLGTGTLSGGSAGFTTSTLPVGTNAIVAVYGGDSKFASSTSKAVSQVVSKATTMTTLASSLNPSKVGQSVTFTASVKPQFGGTVTGTATFDDGTMVLKTVTLSGGLAKFTTSTLASGSHTIKATYNGSAGFDGSSATLTQTVN